jgi:Cu2+-containing amine oxidase
MSESESSYYGGLVDTHLVVRTVVVEFNYDYILDLVFHNNGALEVRVYATGYIMAQWFHAGEDPFGFQVQWQLFECLLCSYLVVQALLCG